MAALTNLTEGIKKNIKDISSAFFTLEFNNARNAKEAPIEGAAQKAIKEALPRNQAGLLVTSALEEAIESCRKKVNAIAKRCRMTNRKFRDIEFDLEKNQNLCRFGLTGGGPPVAVKRVSEIFETPVFFGPDGPNASDVRQGSLGDCWLLAALSAISTIDGLLNKICVARDEEVGVYGFVIFRDSVWKSVIIDDFLLWSMPKYDELTPPEKALFHRERDTYHNVVEKSGKGLLYARSGTVGETWVPLIEKAYAKLHGDYAALEGGSLAEGIEDLTGGVATSFQMSDLLSPDQFWKDEILRADQKTRLFGVALTLDEARSQTLMPTVQGLWPGHAYSILRARECRGKRFVVVRNPWGNSEWTGAWADGAKEWKGEWLQVLGELGHEFGDDGQFVMEYKDFLSVFQLIDRATLFDSSWIMSSYWLRVPPQPALHPWTYGDVYYYIKLDKASSAVIVLSQTDDRYFKNLHGEWPMWYLDFVIYKRGSDEIVGVSGISLGSQRSVSCEVPLEAGEYVVLPRMEPMTRGELDLPGPGSMTMGPDGPELNTWSRLKLSRMLSERAESRLLAANYEVWKEIKNIPLTPEVALEVDDKYMAAQKEKEEKEREEKEKEEREKIEAEKAEKEKEEKEKSEKEQEEKAKVDEEKAKVESEKTTKTISVTESTAAATTDSEKKPVEADTMVAKPGSDSPPIATATSDPTLLSPNSPTAKPTLTLTVGMTPISPLPPMPTGYRSPPSRPVSPITPDQWYRGMPPVPLPPPPMPLGSADAWSEGPPTQPLFLGLRVYTQDGAVATVTGRLKEDA